MTELFALFEKIGKPYFRQGSMSDEDYRPEFFTYWNIDTPELSFYDNKSRRFVELIQVGLYSNDSHTIYQNMDSFIEQAKAAGFITSGKAHDAPADKPNYFGRMVVLQKIAKEE